MSFFPAMFPILDVGEVEYRVNDVVNECYPDMVDVVFKEGFGGHGQHSSGR